MADSLTALRKALRNRYRIEREIGAGGMATVYLAQDLKHDRAVALKVLRPELAATLGPDRFPREIRIVAQLSHPHILPTRIPFDGYANAPAWSPNGHALTFAGHDPAGFDIYVQRVRGQPPVKLAGDRAWEVSPRWSPDGTQIAFVSQKNGNSDIAVVPAAGGEVRFVTTTPADESGFQWTPDGKAFVLTSAESTSELVSINVARLLKRKPSPQ